MLMLAIALYVLGMVPFFLFTAREYPVAPLWQILACSITWPLWSLMIGVGTIFKIVLT